jgi:hypothetical protein
MITTFRFRVIILLMISFCYGDLIPFERLRNHVDTEFGGWHGNQEFLSNLFNEERKRLGLNFRTQLIEFLGENADAHYQCALYLTSDEYLHKNTPMPDFALMLLEQARVLYSSSDGERAEKSLISVLVYSSVLSQQNGYIYLAKVRKSEVENLLKKNDELKYAWPVLSKEEYQIYLNILGPSGQP